MRKFLKDNDKNIETLQNENLSLLNKLKPLEEHAKRLEFDNNLLNNRLKSTYQQIDIIKEIDSPMPKMKKIKKTIVDNDKLISKLQDENTKFIKNQQNIRDLQLENKILKAKNDDLLSEILEIKEKYDMVKEIDSPLKGVNEMKQVLKKTDEKLNEKAG